MKAVLHPPYEYYDVFGHVNSPSADQGSIATAFLLY